MLNPESFPPAFMSLVEAFRRLPGVGEKTAMRYALSLYEQEEGREAFSRAVEGFRHSVFSCERCGNMSSGGLCTLCTDPERSIAPEICVVETVLDLLLMEQTGQYRGRYCVLGGVLSPLDRVGPDDLRIPQLLEQCQEPEVQELILALPATLQGDATAQYLQESLKEVRPDLQITSLARGVAVGGALQYTDEVTLRRALVERR